MKVKFNPGPAKLYAVKTIKENLHLGLKEAKDCVDNGEFECSDEQYPIVKKALIEGGARDFYVND